MYWIHRYKPENNIIIEIKCLNSEWDMCDVCVPTADCEIHLGCCWPFCPKNCKAGKLMYLSDSLGLWIVLTAAIPTKMNIKWKTTKSQNRLPAFAEPSILGTLPSQQPQKRNMSDERDSWYLMTELWYVTICNCTLELFTWWQAFIISLQSSPHCSFCILIMRVSQFIDILICLAPPL